MGWSSDVLKKNGKRCACLGLTELRVWLGVAILLCVFVIVLLRFKIFNAHIMQSYAQKLGNTPHMVWYRSHESNYSSELTFIDSAAFKENSSASKSTVIQLWKHLAPAFARSDCFPEGIQAIKEAEKGWQDLAPLRELNSTNSTGEGGDKVCPYSIGSFNQSQLNVGKLDIPCGLIVDSSVTVVGIPWGAEGNFAIEVIGPKLNEDSEPSVIFHFNVRLQGDKITDDAVIVQNTWNAENGWGEEYRCPFSPGNDVKKVDGYNACSEQVGKAGIRVDSSVLMRSNYSVSSSPKRWFPFTSGLPFVATLWAGWEGFHVTVNGKHISSLEYRKNLKPSLSNSIRIKGSVKLISMIATGLPTTEDTAQVDIGFLKAPQIPIKHKCELFIGVFSTANNFDRRMAVRRSWMQYEAVRSGLVTVRFFVGQHSNVQVNKEIWREAVTYDDIQLMPFVDYYSLITLKTIAICIFGTTFIQPNYIMKTDDDTFVRVDEVLSILNRTEKSKGLLLGSIEFVSYPHRDPSDKWFVTSEEWPYSTYPPWAHGPGYVISLDIAENIVKAHYDMTLKLFKLEDVAMGMWIEEYKKAGHDVKYKNDLRFNNVGCSDGYVIAHYQNQKNMACLWEKLRSGQGPKCCD